MLFIDVQRFSHRELEGPRARETNIGSTADWTAQVLSDSIHPFSKQYSLIFFYRSKYQPEEEEEELKRREERLSIGSVSCPRAGLLYSQSLSFFSFFLYLFAPFLLINQHVYNTYIRAVQMSLNKWHLHIKSPVNLIYKYIDRSLLYIHTQWIKSTKKEVLILSKEKNQIPFPFAGRRAIKDTVDSFSIMDKKALYTWSSKIFPSCLYIHH